MIEKLDATKGYPQSNLVLKINEIIEWCNLQDEVHMLAYGHKVIGKESALNTKQEQSWVNKKGNMKDLSVEGSVKYGVGNIDDTKQEKCTDRAIELLRLILPMAKGYAHKNNVGNNIAFCDAAEQYLIVNGTGTMGEGRCKD